MIDPQQTELVTVLEEQADTAQWTRNSAKDQFDIASYRAQQPPVYRWKRQSTALIWAGAISLGGSLYATGQGVPYATPLFVGTGVSIGLGSKSLDDRRQKREKKDGLNLSRYELEQAETNLRQAVTLYREEQETGWLMYALEIRKEELLALREWMSDPRRTMKDAMLESIDIVTASFLQSPLEADLVSRLPLERHHRQVRQRLLSHDLQLQKDEFLGHVFSKHHLLRDQELQIAASHSNVRTKTWSATGGTVAGLMTGSGISAMGASIAGTLGSSKMAIAHTLASTGSLAALGVGLLAAGTLHRWMAKSETERRQIESQQFHDAFTITTQILEDILSAQTATDEVTQKHHLQTAQNRLKAFGQNELRTQDPQLKQYAGLLGDRLKQYLQPEARRSRLGKLNPFQ
jgi:hypothetical protein